MNTRRSFLKSLTLVPAALAGAVVVAKAAPAKLDLNEMFELGYKIKQKALTTYWMQEERWSSCYSEDYLEMLKKIDDAYANPFSL